MRRVTIHTVGLLAAVCFACFQQAFAECGTASTYTLESREHSEAYNTMDISAAHPSLPIGTRVVVRNQRKGRSIIVRIAGRSSFLLGGIIELSPGAMNALRMDELAPVCLEVVSYGSKKRDYEKPSLAGRLLEAIIPQARHYANAGSRTHSARARTSARSAKAHHRRKHYASARHGRGRRYAHLHRRSHSVKRSRHRRRMAAR